MQISIASSSVSTAVSTRPLVEVCIFQPPSSSFVTGWLMAIEVTRLLATAMVAPLRMTTKSDMQAYQVEDP